MLVRGFGASKVFVDLEGMRSIAEIVWLLDQIASEVDGPTLIVVKHSELRNWVWQAGACGMGRFEHNVSACAS